jgi:hypothetical protein
MEFSFLWKSITEYNIEGHTISNFKQLGKNNIITDLKTTTFSKMRAICFRRKQKHFVIPKYK